MTGAEIAGAPGEIAGARGTATADAAGEATDDVQKGVRTEATAGHDGAPIIAVAMTGLAITADRAMTARVKTADRETTAQGATAAARIAAPPITAALTTDAAMDDGPTDLITGPIAVRTVAAPTVPTIGATTVRTAAAPTVPTIGAITVQTVAALTGPIIGARTGRIVGATIAGPIVPIIDATATAIAAGHR